MKNHIKTKRKEAGLIQQDVAVAAGIGLRHYQSIERGKVLPGVRIAHAIASALHSTVEELWDLGPGK